MKITYNDCWDKIINYYEINFEKHFVAGITRDGVTFMTDKNGHIISVDTGEKRGCFNIYSNNAYIKVECFNTKEDAIEFLRYLYDNIL